MANSSEESTSRREVTQGPEGTAPSKQRNPNERPVGPDEAVPVSEPPNSLLHEGKSAAVKNDSDADSTITKVRNSAESKPIQTEKSTGRKSSLPNIEAQNKIFDAVDTPPELIGGIKWLHENANYSKLAKRAGIEGRVYVRLVVGRDGKPQSVRVTRGVNNLLNREAVRVVKQAEFLPAKIEGRAVRARTTLYVNFCIR